MNHQTIEAVLEQYKTPAYVFDLDVLTQRVKRIQACLKREQIGLCYAMKANPFLTGALEPLVERFEVCSPGEFRICERESLPMERLVVSGVNKEQPDILRIVKEYQGQGIYTIESRQQLKLLSECAREAGKILKVLVRISSGNQFGVSRELAKEMFAEREKYPELVFKGIQYYSGTQKKKLSVIEKELQELDGFCREVKEELNTAVSEIEYGPGFFVPYFQSEPEEDLEALLEEFLNLVGRMEFAGKITLEMGRFLVADCGNFLTSIVDRKENGGQIYGIVDGGIHHLNYFGQTMAMKHPYVQHISRDGKWREQRVVKQPDESTESLENPIQEGAEAVEKEKWNLCGSLCTTADVIVKQFPLKKAQVGDVLVFERTGAYSVTEGINLFLSRDLPMVLLYSEAEGLELLRDTQHTDVLNSRN